MSRSVDRLSWLRLLWGVIHVDGFKWQDPHQALHQLPKAVITTDCKSLYDLVSRLAMPSCEEYRNNLGSTSHKGKMLRALLLSLDSDVIDVGRSADKTNGSISLKSGTCNRPLSDLR